MNISNEILMVMRASKKTQGDVSLSEAIGSDKEGNPISLIDVMSSDDDEVFHCIELKTQMKKLYEGIESELDGREKDIIIKRYGLGRQKSMTQREISAEMGISRSYVSRIEKKCLKKLRKRLEFQGIEN